MSVSKYRAELDYCLAQAAEILGAAAQPVWLEWDLEKWLRGLLKLEARSGLGREPATLYFDGSRRGHSLITGIERYRWDSPEGTIRLARVVVPYGAGLIDDFWAVPTNQYRRFYRLLRRRIRGQAEPAPVMPEAEQKRLWDNTIGFLRRGQEEFRRYGVSPKRGVLLLGEPGNGKTMACRWLSSQCCRSGLDWKNVTAAMYDEARAEREVPELFRLRGPGIILFDDFDAALRDRRETGDADKQSTFLGELDGVRQKTGVVFLFTSNAKLGELDRAMCRPGRLDVVIHFPKPDAVLRRRAILTRWHPDLVAGVDLESVLADTRGFSFAELEEAKKLLVMRYVETRHWDWAWVRQAMLARHVAHSPKSPIGFGAGINGNGRHAAEPAQR